MKPFGCLRIQYTLLNAFKSMSNNLCTNIVSYRFFFLKENEILEETYAVSIQNMSRNIILVKIRNMCATE